MAGWADLVARRVPVVTDGGWGTMFGRMGLVSGEAPDLWNLTRPQDVLGVARSYVEAGSEIILTNTFGGTAVRLAKAGFAGDPAEVNRRGVELSRQAAGRGVLVFADIGPTGEMLEPYGDLPEEEAYGQFRRQAEALMEAGPDGFVIETMMDLNEALVALRAVRSVAPDLPVVVSMTYQRTADGGYATMMGVRPEKAVEALAAEGATVVGANCGSGVGEMVGLAGRLRAAASARGLSVWVKPNAGLPVYEDGRTVYKETPEEFTAAFPRLVEAGAHFVGGCCGTTPEHIRSLLEARRRLFGA